MGRTRASGFEVVTHDVKETASKRSFRAPLKYLFYHTAVVNGCRSKGTVPAKEPAFMDKPTRSGPVVPGMPRLLGMGKYATDAYDVMLVFKDGTARVLSRTLPTA
jgi:hypothetical protein